MPQQDLGGGLTAHVEPRDGGTSVVLSGPITEVATLASLSQLRGPLRIDLAGIARINSLGVRSWIRFIHDCEATGLEVTIERCAPVMVEQISMIKKFMGARSHVASLLVPYYCTSCGSEKTWLVERSAGASVVPPATTTCPKCGGAMQLDVLEDMYATVSASLAGQ
jgi:ABC-type transporter Mla MlaB component